jgi:hypothetical protein
VRGPTRPMSFSWRSRPNAFVSCPVKKNVQDRSPVPPFFDFGLRTLDFRLSRPTCDWGLGHEFRGSSSYQKFVTRPNPWCFPLAETAGDLFSL